MAQTSPSFHLLPSVGTWLTILPVSPAVRLCANDDADTSSDEADEEGEVFLFDQIELLDTIETWRMVPVTLQKTPSDIGELAYKDIHNSVVSHVSRKLFANTSTPRLPVIAVLAAEILYETWNQRQLGQIPRTSESIGAIVYLLSDDVQRATTRLFDTAMDSFVAHIRNMD